MKRAPLAASQPASVGAEVDGRQVARHGADAVDDRMMLILIGRLDHEELRAR